MSDSSCSVPASASARAAPSWSSVTAGDVDAWAVTSPRRQVPLLAEALPAGCLVREISGETMREEVMRHHRHGYWEMFWITKGAATHFNDFRSYALGAGSLVSVQPGRVHAWAVAPATRGYMVAFSDEFLGDGWAGGGRWSADALMLSPVVSVPPERREGVTELWRTMLTEHEEGRPFQKEALRARLELVLIERSRHGTVEAPSAASASARITREFLRLLDGRYRELHHVRHYAALLNITPSTLAKHVQANQGKSPAQLIEARQVLEARRLLVYSSLTVGEIAYEMGFKSPSNFGRFFKQHAGITPGEARNRAESASASGDVSGDASDSGFGRESGVGDGSRTGVLGWAMWESPLLTWMWQGGAGLDTFSRFWT